MFIRRLTNVLNIQMSLLIISLPLVCTGNICVGDPYLPDGGAGRNKHPHSVYSIQPCELRSLWRPWSHSGPDCKYVRCTLYV